jgi:NTP pyrophosphatase (non-canonical NTP hydrolase)
MEAISCSNEINDFSVNELNYIRESIENMNRFNQIEVLRIFKKYSEVIINENKYGIHINLSEIKKEILDELNMYINYVNTQEVALKLVEQKKEDYKNTYFSKDIKDNNKIFIK